MLIKVLLPPASAKSLIDEIYEFLVIERFISHTTLNLFCLRIKFLYSIFHLRLKVICKQLFHRLLLLLICSCARKSVSPYDRRIFYQLAAHFFNKPIERFQCYLSTSFFYAFFIVTQHINYLVNCVIKILHP